MLEGKRIGAKWSMENNLEIINVSKLYNQNVGIKHISACIETGEIVAFVGPNGVGKSTLVKSVAGLIKTSEGEIYLNSVATSEPICKQQIGYMQEDLKFYYKMTVYEILDFICQVRLKDKYYETIDDYLLRYELYDKRNEFINNLSLGMKKKLSIIMALLGEPQLIILDEPTNGVDTLGLLQLKHDLMECVEAGSIVIITSHILDWIEKICTRCIFLRDGIIVKDVHTDSCDLEIEYERLYCRWEKS